MDTPVIFFIFRRPELTARVFQAIRASRPKRLLVIADGPRLWVQGEEHLVKHTRAVVEDIDWDCEVEYLFSDRNLGLRERILTGLDHAFTLFDQAIILEDDCLPTPDFFSFCSTLLNNFSEEHSVGTIAGSNFAPYKSRYSFHFSKAPYIWGWGTWARVWHAFRTDQQKEEWSDQEIASIVEGFSSKAQGAMFEKMMRGAKSLNTWDISFAVWIRQQQMLSVVPRTNLIENIGFGLDATHTKFEAFDIQVSTESLPPPYVGPLDPRADDARERKMWWHKRSKWLTFPFLHPIDFLSRLARYVGTA